MFLDATLRRNEKLVEMAVDFHQAGLLEPDTYVIDFDQIKRNAQRMLDEANAQNIELYFMTKQIGRNPMIAQMLMDLGYAGAVVVDFREAQTMMKANIKIGNIGHLVQTPKSMLPKVISYGVEVFTVFSMEKLKEINDAAKTLNVKQDVILKVAGPNDMFYSGQFSGVELSDLDGFIEEAKTLDHIAIVGATAFPCYLFDVEQNELKEMENYHSVLKGIEVMKKHGLEIKQINVPSTTSKLTLELMKEGPGTHGEPGHGLSGTTPAHAHFDLEELPSVLYLSEISHNFRGSAYCYGGGHYRRSKLKGALIVDSNNQRKRVAVIPPDDDSIDYYFEIPEVCTVSATVIMAFRFQIFVTRSKVALITGIQEGNPEILGMFDSQGRKL